MLNKLKNKLIENDIIDRILTSKPPDFDIVIQELYALYGQQLVDKTLKKYGDKFDPYKKQY